MYFNQRLNFVLNANTLNVGLQQSNTNNFLNSINTISPFQLQQANMMAASIGASSLSSTRTTLNGTFSKSPNGGGRRAKNSAFQELELFFTEIEVLHAFKVYCTETTSFFFTLKKPQVDAIKQNRKNLFLRFCSYEQAKALQKDFLPKDINISINGCCLILESKNSKEKNWKTPIDITTRCRAVTTRNANTIDVNLNSSRKLMQKGYGIEVILAKKLSISEALELLKTNFHIFTVGLLFVNFCHNFQNIRRTDETLKIIKSSCSGFDDIQCDAVKVPLTCVVTNRIIQTPLVGSKCKHVACFEGETFLQMYQFKPEWTCPICYNLIRKNELLRDPLIEDILHSTQRSVEQIEFDQMGNFKVPEPEKVKPKQKSKKIECVTLNDDDDDENDEKNDTSTSQPKLTQQLLIPKVEDQIRSFSMLRPHIDNLFNQNAIPSSSLASSNNNPYVQTPLNASTPSSNIFETLILASKAQGVIDQNCTVTNSRTNSTLLSNRNGSANAEVIELSSGEDDNESVIVLDSDVDEASGRTMNFNDYNSTYSDSDQSSTYLFPNDSPMRPFSSRGRQALFEESTDNDDDDEDDDLAEHSSSNDRDDDSDRTQVNASDDDDDDTSSTIRRRGRRLRSISFSSSSNDFSFQAATDTNDTVRSTLTSLDSNSSISTQSSNHNENSNNMNSSFASSSSSLLQSRDSLRRRRKRIRLFEEDDEDD